LDLFPGLTSLKPLSPPTAPESLKRLGDTPHDYRVVDTPAARAELVRMLQVETSFALAVAASDPDAKTARVLGLGFAMKPHAAFYVPLPDPAENAKLVLGEFRALLENERIEKVGYDLKFALSVLKWEGFNVRGKLFDTMLAHSLIEPDMRHRKQYLAEVCLGYSPLPSPQAPEGELQLPSPGQWSDPTAEEADLVLQLRAVLEPLLRERKQEQVFYEIETPLIPVLVAMEHAGVALDTGALGEFASSLAREMDRLEKRICEMAKREFNLNSSRQLGEILFEQLKICEKPKKTKTGLYATDEQTLTALAGDHEIVRLLLEYRGAAKLKSTYADALPAAVFPCTGRVHTTYHQTQTATGRLNSQNPNLQNIPIRSEQGQEIRKAFVAGSKDTLLLSADYSQIELRIIAALSREAGLLEAFRTGADVHTATAAKVFGVALKDVTAEMRRKAKMVNYGIAYGISPFGLAQRLAISRAEAAEIINSYFNQFSGIREYIDQTIAFARQHGYVQTVTGRRRYLRDIRSANQSVRAGAERNAINMPIQGTAADMIKIAMIRIDRELRERELKTRMLLQVHDELVFELHQTEEPAVRTLVSELMTGAIRLDVPIEIELGVGTNWLAAH
jgi:DNA polymerase-1